MKIINKNKFRDLILGGKVTYMIVFPRQLETVDLCSEFQVNDFMKDILKDPEEVRIITTQEASPIWENLVSGDVPIYQVCQEDGSTIEIYVQKNNE